MSLHIQQSDESRLFFLAAVVLVHTEPNALYSTFRRSLYSILHALPFFVVVPIIDDLVDNTHEPGELRDDGEDGEELMESLLENSTIIYAGEGNDSLYFDVAGANRPEAALDRTQGSGSVLQSPSRLSQLPQSSQLRMLCDRSSSRKGKAPCRPSPYPSTIQSSGQQPRSQQRLTIPQVQEDFREQYRQGLQRAISTRTSESNIDELWRIP
ncbi:hypothetical protein EDD21DRAFT_1871 [Dissophora ornata]|nr:hypothetical protein EDD21DRAFT_1871 [Dissophora ornata]